MRVVAWNILHGGGRRIAEICLDLASWQPDVVVVTEFRRSRGGCLRGALADIGLPHHRVAAPQQSAHAGGGSPNGILVAAREPLRTIEVSCDATRLLAVQLEDAGLSVVGAHMPDTSAGSHRAAAWQHLANLARSMACDPALIIGDLNIGRPGVDGTGLPKRDGLLLGRLAALGFDDLFRRLNGPAPAASWWSHSGRGFRLDHALGSAVLAPSVRDVRYVSGPVLQGRSDHAALVVELAA